MRKSLFRKSLFVMLAMLMVICIFPVLTGLAEDDFILFEDDETSEETLHENEFELLRVANPTKMKGQFFTSLWGNATSDTDVRYLLSDYNLVTWDTEMGLFRFNKSVVSGAIITDDEDGNRTYYLALYKDLMYSDGTPITAWDYAFSALFQCDPVIRELGGNPADYSYLMGYEEYMSGEAGALAGVHVANDNMLMLTVRAESLPYFYEIARVSFYPYPISVIAPGSKVYDNGTGTYIADESSAETRTAFTADVLTRTILDPENGFLSHPSVSSGPYVLTSFDGVTAEFEINPYYKGNENGEVPQIPKLTYTLESNETMVEKLKNGEVDLLNKVTKSQTIDDAMTLTREEEGFTFDSYPRVGLTYLLFSLDSPLVQGKSVRKAIAHCLDKASVIEQYIGYYGIQVEGFYGLGQWMYGPVTGTLAYPGDLPENPTREEELAYDRAVEAWDALSLDGITQYEVDVSAAIDLLAADGWTLNADGQAFAEGDTVRCKRIDDELVKLELTLAYPADSGIDASFSEFFLPNLTEAGFGITMIPIQMEEIVSAHSGHPDKAYDMLYLGDNFNISFDPSLFFGAGNTEEAATAESDTLLTAYATLYSLAFDMCRTDPNDVLTFMQKWILFQERFTDLLPAIPIYSNIYFDFYTEVLHNFDIVNSTSWAQAVVPARMYVEDEEDMELDDLFETDDMEIIDDDEEIVIFD